MADILPFPAEKIPLPALSVRRASAAEAAPADAPRELTDDDLLGLPEGTLDDTMWAAMAVLQGGVGSAAAFDQMVEMLIDPEASWSVREAIAEAFASGKGRARALVPLRAMLQVGLVAERALAATALGWEGNHRAVPALSEALRDGSEAVSAAAAGALAHIGSDVALAAVLGLLEGPTSGSVRRAALRSLGGRPALAARGALRAHFESSDPCTQRAALAAYLLPGPPVDFDDIHTFLSHDDPRLRSLALSGLIRCHRRPARRVLQPLLTDRDERVRRVAHETAERLGRRAG